MDRSINITDREKLQTLLLSLDTATIPLWGKMNPRQMVEHLVDQVEYSNGKKVAICEIVPKEAAKEKQKWIYTDAQIPRNLVLKPAPEDYRYTDMETAIEQLKQELYDFDAYLNKPDSTAVHGGYGPMNHREWVIWHNKHFTHHLRQFGLLEQQ